MILERFPEIKALSPEERGQLIGELSELALAELESDPRFIAELDRRREEYRRDPSTGSSWPQVRKRLRENFPRS
jgi:putative addiction module component (TIGR02574 family)